MLSTASSSNSSLGSIPPAAAASAPASGPGAIAVRSASNSELETGQLGQNEVQQRGKRKRTEKGPRKCSKCHQPGHRATTCKQVHLGQAENVDGSSSAPASSSSSSSASSVEVDDASLSLSDDDHDHDDESRFDAYNDM